MMLEVTSNIISFLKYFSEVHNEKSANKLKKKKSEFNRMYEKYKAFPLNSISIPWRIFFNYKNVLALNGKSLNTQLQYLASCLHIISIS